MALTFEQVIAGAPPTGGDSGSEVARKINDNFNQLSEVYDATKHLLSTSTANLYGLSGAGANADNALSKITAPTLLQTYSTAGTFTYTVPAGVTRITAVIGGAGGGGGSGYSSGWGGGGGGGGAGYITCVSFSVTPGQVLPIVVGKGGTGSPSNSVDATNGGTSSVNGFVSEGGIKGNSAYNGQGAGGGDGSAKGGSSPVSGNGNAGGNSGSGLNQLHGLGVIGAMNLVTRELLGGGGGAGGASEPAGALGGAGGVGSSGNGGNGGKGGSGANSTAGTNGAICCGGGGGGAGTICAGGSGGTGFVKLYAIAIPMGM